MAFLLGLPARLQAAGLSVSVIDSAGKPVADAVVYAIPEAGGATPARGATAVLDQIDKEFVPFVLPVQVGAAVSFPNRDKYRHHVYSFSPPKVFDLKLYSGVPEKPIVFDKPGMVVLGCNIHDDMVGFVYVVETPWFAKTSSKGGATLELPPGEYEVRVWHPWQRGDIARERVKVDAGDTRASVRVDLAPPASARR
ncbi:MAG: methylamine utilization protein [Proteobacteria bacterium]|nr:methylamine utilization protein [Burkholderiales bacterium]